MPNTQDLIFHIRLVEYKNLKPDKRRKRRIIKKEEAVGYGIRVVGRKLGGILEYFWNIILPVHTNYSKITMTFIAAKG